MKNDKNALISIIVPVYNVEKYIEQCIKSILNQTYKNIEVIVVVDGSKDNSLSIVKKIKKTDDRITIIEQKNQGVSCARNNGLKSAKGEYVIFIDADDYISDDFVEYMYSLISKGNSDFAFSIKNYWEENEKQEKNLYEKKINSNEAVGLLLSPDVTVGCWNKIYKKSFLNKNNILFRSDLFYGEGLNFIIRTALATNKIVIGNKKVYYYRKNNVMSATSKFSFDKLAEPILNGQADFVKSMFLLHISTFYLGAISKLIENKCKETNIKYYKSWKKNIKNNLSYIIFSKYVSFYRKTLLFVGVCSPYLISRLNSLKDKRNIIKSVK